ncbi:hypothetical protein B0G73_129103 [Paraburkholderia sp. BL25I1N1]|nr:hypothetical protein B0G73_129103 [Paraburkholderia sp. BL25I1N1]
MHRLEKVMVGGFFSVLAQNPPRDTPPSLLRNFELHPPLSFLLHGRRTRDHVASYADVLHLQPRQVARAKLAINRQAEQCQLTNIGRHLKSRPNRPDFAELQWRLLAGQAALVLWPNCTRRPLEEIRVSISKGRLLCALKPTLFGPLPPPESVPLRRSFHITAAHPRSHTADGYAPSRQIVLCTYSIPWDHFVTSRTVARLNDVLPVFQLSSETNAVIVITRTRCDMRLPCLGRREVEFRIRRQCGQQEGRGRQVSYRALPRCKSLRPQRETARARRR